VKENPLMKLLYPPQIDIGKEVIQAKEAITKGVPMDKVKQMFKQRTGEEWPE